MAWTRFGNKVRWLRVLDQLLFGWYINLDGYISFYSRPKEGYHWKC